MSFITYVSYKLFNFLNLFLSGENGRSLWSSYNFSGYWTLISRKYPYHSPANIRLDEYVLKTSWRRFSSSSSEDVFKTSSRRLDPDEYVRLTLRHVFKTSWSRPIFSPWPYVFKTSSRCFRDVFKTSSRPLQSVFKTSSSCFEDVFKAYHQVNLFYLTRPREIFNMFLSTEEFT